jgi:hypothetical protein
MMLVEWHSAVGTYTDMTYGTFVVNENLQCGDYEEATANIPVVRLPLHTLKFRGV